TSQRVPWTAKTSLAKALSERGIAYEHVEALGGFRRARPDSVNLGWRNSGFRGYADHIATAEFSAGLDLLIAIASERRTAIMCAEAVPWKCHRSLLSDALLVHGVRVVHILSPRKTQDHRLTPFAPLHGTQITYPATRQRVPARHRPHMRDARLVSHGRRDASDSVTRSAEGESAVHDNRLAGDVRRVIGGEERHDPCDFFGSSPPPQRGLLGQRFVVLRSRGPLRRLGGDAPEGERIHANPVRAVNLREGTREGQNPTLCHEIRNPDRVAGQGGR